MIRSIVLKFGRAPGIAAEAVRVTPSTVFVGPNNSGKSKVLQELFRFFSTGQRSSTDLILDRVEFEELPHDRAEFQISRVTLPPHAGEAVQPQHIIVGKKGHSLQINRQDLLRAMEESNARPAQFCPWYIV